MVAKEGFGYLGQAMSGAELAAVLYGAALGPDDRLVISPGHYWVLHFAAGVERGLFEESELLAYGDTGSLLESIGTERTPGLAATCGSLGQGLSVAAGLTLSHKIRGSQRRTYALASDGEMEEGQLWEAALFAAHHGLSKLTALLDRNNSQVDGPTEAITTIEPVIDKWRSFGWAAVAVDGHDVNAVRRAVVKVREDPRPGVVIGSTWTLSGLVDVVSDESDGRFLKVSQDQIQRATKLFIEAERTAARVEPAPWSRQPALTDQH
jgi:transketolase